MATDFGRLPFELLDVDNYATWQTRMMKFLLITRGLWIAVTSNGFSGGHHGRAEHHGRKSSKTCDYCGRVGHIMRYCRKKERDEAANGTRTSKVYSAIAL